MALMGASGLMTCVYALTKINYTYHIPMFIFTTLRGVFGDPRPHHISNGLYLTRLMDSISLPYLLVEEKKPSHASRRRSSIKIFRHPATEPIVR